jgi:hypothetical protein
LNTIARLNARPATDPVVVAQFEEITHAVQLERSLGSGSWRQLFAWRDDELKNRRRLLIACFIQAAQQLGGINGIVSVPFRLRAVGQRSNTAVSDLLRRQPALSDWIRRTRLISCLRFPLHCESPVTTALAPSR